MPSLDISHYLKKAADVEISTMIKTPCRRYKGEFLGRYFRRCVDHQSIASAR